MKMKADLAEKTAVRIKKIEATGISDIPETPTKKHAGGRPTIDKPKKGKIVLYLPEDDYLNVKRIAQDEGESMSNLCRRLVFEYIKNK